MHILRKQHKLPVTLHRTLINSDPNKLNLFGLQPDTRVMKIRLAIILLTVILIGLAFGSGEGNVDFDEITLVSKANQIEIKMTGMNSDRPEIQVKIHEKVINVGAEFLFVAKNIRYNSIRLISQPSNPGQIPPGGLAKHGFIVSYELGGTYEHGKNEEGGEVLVHRVIRLHFSEKELERSELALPLGEFSNKWRVYEKEKGSGKLLDDFVESSSVKCPWHASVDER